MSIVGEFREFAVKGNVVDMAVGIVVGGAFTKIVNSLVNDIFMPPLGLLIGGVDFSELKITLKAATTIYASPVTLRYGLFLQTVVQFLIVAWAIFMMVKVINLLRRQQEAKQQVKEEVKKETA